MKNQFDKKSSPFPLIALVLFLLALAGAFFYVKPTWDEVTSLEIARAEKTDQRNDLNQELVDLQTLQQELQQVSEVTRETTLTAIPEKLNQDQLILDLARIAEENDMNFSGIGFGIPTSMASGEVASATISLNVTGNQSQLISFLRDLEGNTRKILVKSITVQVGETDVGISRVNFNLSMETYFQGEI